MGISGLTRRGLTAGLAAAVVPSKSAGGAVSDGTWAMLVRELRAAEQAQRVAMASFAEAERRFFALSARRRKGKLSSSYLEAQRAEMAAGEAVEAVHQRIAKTPAVTSEGLLTKARLAAHAYGIDPDAKARRLSEDDDLMSCLLRSLIADLAEQSEPARR